MILQNPRCLCVEIKGFQEQQNINRITRTTSTKYFDTPLTKIMTHLSLPIVGQRRSSSFEYHAQNL
jgi:hypothetical protein